MSEHHGEPKASTLSIEPFFQVKRIVPLIFYLEHSDGFSSTQRASRLLHLVSSPVYLSINLDKYLSQLHVILPHQSVLSTCYCF